MVEAAVKIGMAPPHPGEFIRDELLEERGLTVSAAAEALGVRRATLSFLVSGKARLSPEMALRVEKVFGMSMDTLLRMQAWHDAHAMRQRANEVEVNREAGRRNVIEGAVIVRHSSLSGRRVGTISSLVVEVLREKPAGRSTSEIRKVLGSKGIAVDDTSINGALVQLTDGHKIAAADGLWRIVESAA